MPFRAACAIAICTQSGNRSSAQVEFRNARNSAGTLLEGKKYTYDALGNITMISQSTGSYYPLVAYEYDAQNQLVKETYYDGNGAGSDNVTATYTYIYDTAGNILSETKKTGSTTSTKTYTYGNSQWNDLLTSFNGTAINYDAAGNPLHYGAWDFSWQNGHQLSAAEKSEGMTDTALSYAYDADGIRRSKTYTVSTYEDIPQYTVTFVADGTTVKTMTVDDGYVLQNSDYPTVPEKAGHSGTWQQHTAAIHSNVTIQAVYTLRQYTVTFIADVTTVKTMTVNYGYVLQESDYPTIPEKTGYTGAWQQYNTGIHADVTVQASYTIIPCTVTFIADNTPIKTMTVEYGYVLQTGDYPTVPEKTGYSGAWQQHTDAIHADVTIQAVYAIHQYTVTFVADGTTVKTMTVNYGYALQESDYPTVPEKTGYDGSWIQYAAEVHTDVQIEAKYTIKTYNVTFRVRMLRVGGKIVPYGYILKDSDYPTGYEWERYTQPIYSDIVIQGTEDTGSGEKHTVSFMVDDSLFRVISVDDGYVLKLSDYPAVPPRIGYIGTWNKYTAAIHEDITITAEYKKSGTEVMSAGDETGLQTSDVLDEENPTSSQNAAGATSTAIHDGQTLVSTQTVQHDYVTQNGKVVRETVRTNGTVTAVMDFIYDESGSPFAFRHSTNGSSFTTYYYVLNLQGDVVKLITASGATVAEYTYNAWGEVLTATGTMASINPLRYRSYYYDTETGFYYLQSRYYDPVTHRFINADSYTSTDLDSALASNMFAYCENNPVNNLDPFGRWTLSFSIGVDFSFFFFGVSASIGIAIDDDANVAIQWSYSAPNYINNNETYNVGLADVGAGASLQVTDDDTVHDLEGPSCYAGFSAGDGVYGGIDMVYTGYEMMDEDAVDVLPNGIQITIGCGIGIDTHFRQTQTETLLLIK